MKEIEKIIPVEKKVVKFKSEHTYGERGRRTLWSGLRPLGKLWSLGLSAYENHSGMLSKSKHMPSPQIFCFRNLSANLISLIYNLALQLRRDIV